MGNSKSTHNKSSKSVVDLMNATKHIDVVMNRETSEHIQKNRLRLASTVEYVHCLSLQGCGLRGHDESSYSQNRSNFIEMLKLLGKWNASIEDVVLDKAPGNARYTSPEVQKEILHIIGNGVRNKIRDEIGDSKFCILVDEAKDVSNKEQMTIILRFVNAHGFLRKHFFQIMEELNSRFSDETVELLILSFALDPKDNFKWFKIDKICTLAEKCYPEDFTEQEMHHLR
ncbi:uncharacterized protein [Primulina eburnea]|uniref:uncharacterized protein n=1 Tax=Primulina eburnea TaxID=1245227 RepID=UPI003C6C2203